MAPDSPLEARRGLDEFMWMEILLRLPSTKHVFQCKCVSNRWNSLISDGYFIRRFIDHHREKYGTDFNAELLLFFDYYSMKDKLNVGFLASRGGDAGEGTKQGLALPWGDEEGTGSILPRPMYNVESSFNDLVVCSETRSLTYYIVNPFTKDHVEIPLYDPDRSYNRNPCRKVGFVCEPFYTHGGRQFDPEANYRYRVVRIIDSNCFGDCRIEMYCSETKHWRRRTGLDLSKHGCLSNVAAHGGKLYWYNLIGEVVAYDPFGASNEQGFDFLELDKAQTWSGCRNFQLAQSQGSLLLMQLTKEMQESRISIWKLKEEAGLGDCEAFCFERTVTINHIISDSSPSFISREVHDGDTLLVLGVHPSNRDVIFLGYDKSAHVASYNLGTEEWQVVGEIPKISNLLFLFHKFGVPTNLPWYPTPVH